MLGPSDGPGRPMGARSSGGVAGTSNQPRHSPLSCGTTTSSPCSPSSSPTNARTFSAYSSYLALLWRVVPSRVVAHLTRRWREIVRDHARSCEVMRDHVRSYEIVRDCAVKGVAAHLASTTTRISRGAGRPLGSCDARHADHSSSCSPVLVPPFAKASMSIPNPIPAPVPAPLW